MMLVQKPQSAILSAPPTTFTHRRHPSAPVVVQPTRTPGLLTLSKPLKPVPQRQPLSQQRREPKTTPRAPKHGSVVVRAQPVTETQQVVAQALPATPSPQSRGRTQAKQAREKADGHRSASQSSVRGKHGRQPSPPVTAQQPTQLQSQQTPSQAEATIVPTIKSTNLFDPFLDNSNSPPPSPLASKPSGKLARRRQQQPQSATPSKAIPVPNTQRTNPSNLSRSDPLPTRMRPRPVPQRSATYHDFPICDDMTEVADHDYTLSPPPTPRRPTTNYSGPQTAPLSGRNPGAFPFTNMDLSTPPATTAKRGSRKHQRVPSEGVFNMSSDEDVSTGPGGFVLNENVQVLFGMTGNKRSSLPSSPFTTPRPARAAMSAPPRSRESSPSSDSLSREKQLEREANEKAGYFASSMFQNSPSPEELPDPLLL